MAALAELIFAGMLMKYEPQWAMERETKAWERWEECERMREKMGHTTDIVKIQKHHYRTPRKKHRH